MAIGMRMLNFLSTRKFGRELSFFIFLYRFAPVLIFSYSFMNI